MHRGKNEVTCLSSGDSSSDRLEVTHLTNEDDIRVFTEGRVESVCERICIAVELTLVDHSAVMRIDVLDRILDRDNMSCLILIDVVNDSSHGSCLTGTRRTCNKDDTVLRCSHIFNDFRNTEFFELRDSGHQEADTAGKVVTLMIYVRSDSDLVVDHETEVDIFAGLNTLDLFVGQDRIDHGERFFRCRTLVENMEYSVSSNSKIGTYSNMHVGTILFYGIIH